MINIVDFTLNLYAHRENAVWNRQEFYLIESAFLKDRVEYKHLLTFM